MHATLQHFDFCKEDALHKPRIKQKVQTNHFQSIIVTINMKCTFLKLTAFAMLAITSSVYASDNDEPSSTGTQSLRGSFLNEDEEWGWASQHQGWGGTQDWSNCRSNCQCWQGHCTMNQCRSNCQCSGGKSWTASLCKLHVFPTIILYLMSALSWILSQPRIIGHCTMNNCRTNCQCSGGKCWNCFSL